MAAITGNIQMFAGEDLPLVDKIYESDGTTPQDVSRWSAELVIHPVGDPGTALIGKSTGAGTLVPSNPSPPTVAYNWAFAATILRAETLDSDGRPVVLPGQSYGYRYTRTDAGNNTVLTVGLFTISV